QIGTESYAFGFLTSLVPKHPGHCRRAEIGCRRSVAVVVVLEEPLGHLSLQKAIESPESQGLPGLRIHFGRNDDLEGAAVADRRKALAKPARTGEQVHHLDRGSKRCYGPGRRIIRQR